MHDPRSTRSFWTLAAVGAALTGIGFAAAHFMESRGHVVTGMGNEVVWGLPHVFAIFMIVAASGVLNMASLGSVFGQAPYKARARLSGLLSLALLAGGLMVLMLDLGRPERVLVAATHYNFRSVFAWNVFLYSGLAAIVLVYLWTMLQPGLARWSKPAGIAALAWRFVLTTGTGSIFGFLVAREAYRSALLAPLFILFSLAWGLALFLLVEAVLQARGAAAAPDAVRERMARLLAIFVAACLYLVAVQHITHGYEARRGGFQAFLLLGRGGGATYAALFWAGYVLLGSVLPLALLFHPRWRTQRGVTAAAALVLLGAFAWLYAFIVGGQAFPLEIFPGHAVRSSFGDGAVARYVPSLPEALLGAGGLGAAWLLTLVGMHLFDMKPHDAPAAPAKA
ncbi:NrfD/PsrC family molybdoenzyme membrane anchor subunit [Ramlibacter sp. AN1133]|uniref:NrfD/PsrC family molybdoenzyme membrane anchor subunit n=1 Tax=Ramlibacter sp. AN1133 TaxID=3133429 RepID=UPI0030C02560